MKSKKTSLVLVLFLLGIFMGAIDSGIVSPAREIIENSFNVSRSIGIWMITIYTLAYAIAMPIVSKLADRHGHKKVYTIAIIIFASGSLLSGLSNFYGTFTFFLCARVIQAIGAGGIMPIATTVIGQSFPEEKRGSALGLVGGIYGIATIVGPTLGSSILSFAGNAHWGWIFFINLPISIIIVFLSTRMENTKGSKNGSLDFIGALVLAGTIGSFMYALTNIDFFNFISSIKNSNVYIFLIIFVILIPILIFVEGRAKDPILNLKYFRNNQMIIIFILALIVGIGMMGMVFVPQFAENVLRLKAGKGGYLITLLAVFSGIAAPFSGRLIDKKGAAFVMITGFLFTASGTLFLGFVATKYLTFVSIFIGLVLMGFGVGFTMGAPLNYLVLAAVPEEEGAIALATMSLMRSIGVTISPNIMIGFIVNAAKNLQPNLMTVIQKGLAPIMPHGMSMTTFSSNPSSAKAFASLQNADVTNIVNSIKDIFIHLLPQPAGSMVSQAIEKMRGTIETVFQSTLNKGYTNMFIAAASIAAVGFLVSLLLLVKGNNPASKVKDQK